jgi:cytochrome c biogenesis protein CcmG, thiol:disulfide interchange protein DsbE
MADTSRGKGDSPDRDRQSGRARAAQRRKQERRKGQMTLLAVVGGLAVLVLVIFALWSASGDDDRGELTEVGTVTVSGDALPEYGGDPSADSAVGMTAPTVTASNLRDEPDLTIAPDGTTKVLIFLAHWCPHCRAEVPVLQDWLEASGGVLPSDIQIMSIATGLDPTAGNYPPSEWLFADEGWQFPVMIDDANSTIGNMYGLSSYPFYVAVNGQNQVIARSSGEFTVEQWEQFLTTARAGAGTVDQGEGSSDVDGTDNATDTTAATTDTTAATEETVATEPETTTTAAE